MVYTYEQLSKMTVAELRQIADTMTNEELKGHSIMHKEKLLPLLCHALGIEAHAHHEAKGINKAKIKQQIRALKKDREAALQNHDSVKLHDVRHQIHHLKRLLRKALT
jgi:hypothetical protein